MEISHFGVFMILECNFYIRMASNTDSDYCSVGIRGIAMFIDSFIWFLLTFIAIPIVGLFTGNIETSNGVHTDLGGMAAVIGLSLWFTFAIGYHTICEWKFGQTIGKYLVSIRVTHESGSPPSLQNSFMRNLIRIIDWFPAFYIVGIGVSLISDRYQRIGDRVANTVVVRE
ncbi:RDD family protein [Natrinema altunense]|nr:RDD family protein [Natrinema altunense]